MGFPIIGWAVCLLKVYFLRVSVLSRCVHICRVHALGNPGSEAMCGSKPCGCWEANVSPLQEPRATSAHNRAASLALLKAVLRTNENKRTQDEEGGFSFSRNSYLCGL